MALTTDTVSGLMRNQPVNVTNENTLIYGRYEFLKTRTLVAIPVVSIITVALVAGTFGNVLILVVICSNKLGRNVTTTFILNLALSDMFVTLVVDPMSVLGKLWTKIIVRCLICLEHSFIHFLTITDIACSSLILGENIGRSHLYLLQLL